MPLPPLFSLLNRIKKIYCHCNKYVCMPLSIITDKDTYALAETVQITVETMRLLRTRVDVIAPDGIKQVFLLHRKILRSTWEISWTIPPDALPGIYTLKAGAMFLMMPVSEATTTFTIA